MDFWMSKVLDNVNLRELGCISSCTREIVVVELPHGKLETVSRGDTGDFGNGVWGGGVVF